MFEIDSTGSLEIILNTFKNMAQLLSQLLVTSDVTLGFLVEAIQRWVMVIMTERSIYALFY